MLYSIHPFGWKRIRGEDGAVTVPQSGDILVLRWVILGLAKGYWQPGVVGAAAMRAIPEHFTWEWWAPLPKRPNDSLTEAELIVKALIDAKNGDGDVFEVAGAAEEYAARKGWKS